MLTDQELRIRALEMALTFADKATARYSVTNGAADFYAFLKSGKVTGPVLTIEGGFVPASETLKKIKVK